MEVLKPIYLSPPHMSGCEQQYVADAFETNWIAPLGPNVEAFENEVAEYVGVKGAVALSSGTAAIHIALKLLGVSAGDIVFCSSLTFAASANPIIYEKAIPVFIDSEPETWNMSPKALEKAFIAAKRRERMPKAVVIVNLYGQSADMDQLLEICHFYQVPVVEDAAESLGANYKGRASGTMGNFGVYSFNGNKIITASSGGMLISNDLAALAKAKYWASQSRDPAIHYQHSELGYNYRMSNVLAGIGRGQLKVLDQRVEKRRAIFSRYFEVLGKIQGIFFMPEASSGKPSRWLTALTIDPRETGVSSIDVVKTLAKNCIEARPVWKPLHLQPVFEGCEYYQHNEKTSISDQLFQNGICLPSGSSLSENDQARIIEVFLHCLNRVA